MPSQAWLDANNDLGIDFLKPNAFRLQFHNIPHVSYLCQVANIPGFALETAIQPTRLIDMPLAGDKGQFDELTVSFLIDSKLKNYTELLSWIIGLAFPDTNQEFTDLRASGKNKSLSTTITPFNEESGLYTDASMTILTGKNNPFAVVFFEDIWPTRISGLPFDSAISDIQYLTATASFKFKTYHIEIPGLE